MGSAIVVFMVVAIVFGLTLGYLWGRADGIDAQRRREQKIVDDRRRKAISVYGSRDLISHICEAMRRDSTTLCPKLGAAQWTCTREECRCHLFEYAHAADCTYRSSGWTALGKCNCGALTRSNQEKTK